MIGAALGLLHELSEIAEGAGRLGFDEALGRGGEQSGEGAVEITGGDDVGCEELTDIAAGFFGFEVGAIFLAVVEAEAQVVGELGHGAAASIGKGEVTQVGAILIFGHRSLRKNLSWK